MPIFVDSKILDKWKLIISIKYFLECYTYEEKPIKILETAERVTRTKTIKFYKVQWNHHNEEEATWEREDDLREDHPHLFASHSESRGRDSS